MIDDVKKCLILNPVAKGEKAKRFFKKLTNLANGWIIEYTKQRGDAAEIAARAVKEGCSIIVCAGGDGTVNEVVNGIGLVEDGFERTRVGVIPVGTSNVFARTFNIPLDPLEAWGVINEGNIKVIDLPYAEYEENNQLKRRYFVQLGGAGMDARAVELLSWKLKKKIGWLAYVWAGLKALAEPQPTISINSDGSSKMFELILFGNGKYYGGSYNLFPEANPSDGFLDLAVYEKVNYWTALRCASGLITKNFKNLGGVKYLRLKRFDLISSSRTGFQLDGEFVGLLPVKVTLIPDRLKIIVP